MALLKLGLDWQTITELSQGEARALLNAHDAIINPQPKSYKVKRP